MCIICNVTEPTVAGEFLDSLSLAQHHMRETARLMKAASEVAGTEEARRAYDRHYKRLVKANRDWNRLEELREVGLRHREEA